MSESSALCATCYQEADVELASLRKQYSSILDKAAEKDDEVWQAYIQNESFNFTLAIAIDSLTHPVDISARMLSLEEQNKTR